MEGVVAYDDYSPPRIEGTSRRYFICRYDTRKPVREVVYDPAHREMACTCQLFESTGFPCRHQLYVMKKERLVTLLDSCILKRWTKDAKSVGENKNVIPTFGTDTMCSVRYGFLLSMFKSLCSIASKTEKTFSHIRGEISRLTQWANDSNGISRTCDNVDDSIIPRKRSRAEESPNGRSNARKCSVCHHTGHTKRKCPLVRETPSSETAYNVSERNNDLQLLSNTTVSTETTPVSAS